MRAQCTTERIKTEFGKMYLHVDTDAHGRPLGGSISTPHKEPESQITRLVHAQWWARIATWLNGGDR